MVGRGTVFPPIEGCGGLSYYIDFPPSLALRGSARDVFLKGGRRLTSANLFRSFFKRVKALYAKANQHTAPDKKAEKTVTNVAFTHPVCAPNMLCGGLHGGLVFDIHLDHV